MGKDPGVDLEKFWAGILKIALGNRIRHFLFNGLTCQKLGIFRQLLYAFLDNNSKLCIKN